MVERHLAKVNVAGSNLVSRSKKMKRPCGVFSFCCVLDISEICGERKIAGAICLPDKHVLRHSLTANQTIDNRLSGRAAKGATLVSRAKCGLLCARNESRDEQTALKRKPPRWDVCLFGAGDESPCFFFEKPPPSQLQIARLILLKTIINRFLNAKFPLGVRLSLIM